MVADAGGLPGPLGIEGRLDLLEQILWNNPRMFTGVKLSLEQDHASVNLPRQDVAQGAPTDDTSTKWAPIGADMDL